MVARSKQSSGKKQASGGAPPEADGARAREADTKPVSRPIIVIATAVVAVVAGSLMFQFLADGWRHALSGRSPAGMTATYVGSESCASCHRAEAELWRASQHQHAMDHATDKSVLGDFNDASFDYYGVRSRFFRRDGKYFVETDGPDGKLATFEVKYTFGVDPLQQYLIEFPDGRLQPISRAVSITFPIECVSCSDPLPL